MTGRSLAEIDGYSVQDVNDILGYWTGRAKASRELKSWNI